MAGIEEQTEQWMLRRAQLLADPYLEERDIGYLVIKEMLLAHDARVTELLAANSVEVERRREAESERAQFAMINQILNNENNSLLSKIMNLEAQLENAEYEKE